MTRWTVQMELDSDPDSVGVDQLEDALSRYDATVSRIPGEGVLVVAHNAADSMLRAAADVERAVLDVAGAVAVLSLTLMPEQIHEARADRPTLPQLVSSPEVAEMLGVSRQRVHQLRASANFPAPLFELRTGPIWDVRAIARFARIWDRKPGRRTAS